MRTASAEAIEGNRMAEATQRRRAAKRTIGFIFLFSLAALAFRAIGGRLSTTTARDSTDCDTNRKPRFWLIFATPDAVGAVTGPRP
jgi:hypothetical protein